MRASKTKTEIRQDQIAAAALELMARHGPKSLNIAAVARKVGVVPSALYRHYPGKDAVLDAGLDRAKASTERPSRAAGDT